jgi:hypothetical protein
VTGRLQTVHVRVNDAATGQPTPVRVRFADAEGKYYAPFGRLTTFATDWGEDVGGNLLLGSEAHAYIDGTCEIALPPGQIRVAIAKGPEYRPIREEIDLPPGKLALRFVIERWADMRAEGWYSGDTRSHFLTPHAALLEGAAEDLAVVNLLAWEWESSSGEQGQCRSIPNILAFSGQVPALEKAGHMVVVNTMNVHKALGSLLLLNCHRVVYPLSSGMGGDMGDWTLAEWCEQCHRKGGLVIADDFFYDPDTYPHGEILADVILGKIDALQMDHGIENPEADSRLGQAPLLKAWYQLLDAGFRVPLTGGSDKTSNLDALGVIRTYALLHPGEPLTYKTWIEAVRAGRTFVTTGPLLTFTVNDEPPGAVLDLPATAAPVRIHAEARSLTPFERLEVLANNRVVASAAAAGSPAQRTVEADVSMPQGGWLVARCWGPWDDDREQWRGAQSSPVYVQVEGNRPPPDPAAVATLADWLGKAQHDLEQGGRGATEQQQRLASLFEQARAALPSSKSTEPGR